MQGGAVGRRVYGSLSLVVSDGRICAVSEQREGHKFMLVHRSFVKRGLAHLVDGIEPRLVEDQVLDNDVVSCPCKLFDSY